MGFGGESPGNFFLIWLVTREILNKNFAQCSYDRLLERNSYKKFARANNLVIIKLEFLSYKPINFIVNNISSLK